MGWYQYLSNAQSHSTFILVMIIITIIIIYISLKNSKKTTEITPDSLLNKYNITSINQLNKEIFELFAATEEAKTREDEIAIKYLCSPELSKKYLKELSNLHEMELEYTNKNFELISLELKDIKEENNYLLVTAVIKTKGITYIQSSKGELVDGDIDDKDKLLNTLIVKKDLNKKSVKCSNCQAELSEHFQNKCEYCNTPFNYKSTKWTLLSNSKGDRYEEK